MGEGVAAIEEIEDTRIARHLDPRNQRCGKHGNLSVRILDPPNLNCVEYMLDDIARDTE
jgi:hypothetical protein